MSMHFMRLGKGTRRYEKGALSFEYCVENLSL